MPPQHHYQQIYLVHYAYLAILLDNQGLFLLSCCEQHPKFEDLYLCTEIEEFLQ
ncbi:hypothetical protein HanXRQr2_Chr04g0148491 [Helianthus annuus]|uniref:Uncharacterized protein n=1 Tax=Helianthus annuus TaxID=4232 RepID=A0A9K3J5I4_HELAN|nr:hypothetical protein HanXRQr2_Chr04g0148491 [Helianthus annuus]